MKRFINFAFIAAIGLASCSKSDDIQTGITEDSGLKKLASVVVENTEGVSDSIPGTRTPASVNENYKPTQIYKLNFVNLLTVNVVNDLVQNPSTEYEFTKEAFVTHNFTNDESNANYDVYYQITSETHNPEASNSGTITLSSDDIENENDIKIKLTTFKNEDLQNLKIGDKILGINNFYFGGENPNGIGSVLFYLTYDPESKKLSLPEIDKNHECVPYLTDTDHNTLYNEYGDVLFLSKEILIAATDDNIYIFKTIKDELENGYELLRIYQRKNSTKVDRFNIEMERLTTIVNASFLIEDTYEQDNKEGSYFDPDKISQSLHEFEKRYGFSLEKMSCPYATIDGVAFEYDINNRKIPNTYGTCRMVLWAEGLRVKGPDGITEFDKMPKIGAVAMKSGKVYWGYGAEGNSYSVIFKCDIQNGNLLRFFTKIAGKNIIIYTELKNLELRQNYANHLTLLVKADELKKYIKPSTSVESRTNSNGYIEMEVPSENLIIN